MEESRRVRMTKRMLKDSLLELMTDRPLSKITVKDICENADVNRTTFYVHFQSVEQMLADVENDVFAQIPAFRDMATASSQDAFLQDLEAFYDYVRANERLFRVLILNDGNGDFSRRLAMAVFEKYRGRVDAETMLSNYQFMYCLNGVIGVTKLWIADGFPISSRKIAELTLTMSLQAAGISSTSLALQGAAVRVQSAFTRLRSAATESVEAAGDRLRTMIGNAGVGSGSAESRRQ